MRFLITEWVPALEDALRLRGHEVVSEPSVWMSHYMNDNVQHPRDYPLEHLVLTHKPRVAILVDPMRVVSTVKNGLVEMGYYKAHTKAARRYGTGLVLFVRDDPDTRRRYAARAYRDCTCSPADQVSVYVSTHAESVQSEKGVRRASWWNNEDPGGSCDRLLAALAHGMAGRTYSPSRDFNLW